MSAAWHRNPIEFINYTSFMFCMQPNKVKNPFEGLLQVPKCFGLVQFFCARPRIYLHIVADTNVFSQTKRCFAFCKIGFCASTKVFEEALNAVKFLGCLKKFGPAQNILGPVKGRGIRCIHDLNDSLRNPYFRYDGNLAHQI